MVLGLVVGKDLIDSNFRRAILAGRGSLAPFFTRPFSLALIALLLIVVLKDLLAPVIKRRRKKTASVNEAE